MIFTDKLKEAIYFASEKHKDQKRKILGYPYISHPLSVMYIASNHTKDENVLISAILHDTVEDTDTSLDDIENKFGKQIRDIVDLLTEDKTILDKRIRKQKQLKRFDDANHEVLLIKLADIINNFCDISIVLENYPAEEYLKVFGGNIKIKIIDSENRISVIEKAWADNPLINEAKYRLEEYKNLLKKHELLNS
jgi:guanosine-3',5'-bis(diphosphate) 3'-pyrophosphohydrolase